MVGENLSNNFLRVSSVRAYQDFRKHPIQAFLKTVERNERLDQNEKRSEEKCSWWRGIWEERDLSKFPIYVNIQVIQMDTKSV